MEITKALAAQLACSLIKDGADCLTWECMRDFVDERTGSELDCWQLDTLTDWVIETTKQPAHPRAL